MRVLVVAVALVGTLASAAPGAAAPGARVDVVGSGSVVGDLDGVDLAAPVVDLAAFSDDEGYWMAAADGGVFAFGAAPFLGSMGGLPLNAPIVAMESTPSGSGYWLAAADGGVFAFGAAGFFGSLGAVPLNRPVVAMSSSASGEGYWLIAADGGVFAFGDAPFLGSLGADPPPDGAVDAAPVGVADGYVIASASGSVFAFGAARDAVAGADIEVEAVVSTGDGYRLVASDGTIVSFGVEELDGPVLEGERVVAADAVDGGVLLATVPDRIRIVAGGDVHGEGRVGTLLAEGDDPLTAVADTVAGADVAVVNLETAVGTTGRPAAKTYTFQAPVALVESLARSGVDVVDLANNHALDYGRGALLETLAVARAAGLVTIGAGVDAAEAYAPAVVATDGGPVAMVGLTMIRGDDWPATADRPGVADGRDRAASVAAVRAAATQADTVVVVVHWGVELERCASAAQRDLASALLAAGADVILGHHPHVWQGVDPGDGTLVAYSLGNLVWYHSRLPSARTGLLTVTTEGGRVVDHEIVPAVIDERGRPVPSAGAAAAEVLDAAARFRPGAGVCPR